MPTEHTSELLPDMLERRARLYLAICAPHIATKPQWGAGYTLKEDLFVAAWSDTHVDYRRSKAASCSVYLDDVQGDQLRNISESEPVLLKERVIDAASIEVLNKQPYEAAQARYEAGGSTVPWDELELDAWAKWGAVAQPWGPYVGEFEKTTSKKDAFEKSLDTSTKIYAEKGGEAAGYKVGIEQTISAHFGWSNETSEDNRTSRSFSFNGEAPPGLDMRYTAWRKVGQMRSTIKAEGGKEYSIRIQKHWHGKWQGNGVQWKSHADFMRCATGRAPSDWDLANTFRKYPPPKKMLDELQKPLDQPYIQTLKFDQATSIRLRPESF